MDNTDVKINFTYEKENNKAVQFVAPFLTQFGQTDVTNADVIVSVGGDGSLLHAFRDANAGQQCFGLAIPGSNSTGFWINKNINTPTDLLHSLNATQQFEIAPLKATITFKDKTETILNAFNEVVANTDSGQSMLTNLNVENNGNTIGPIRLMGDGLIIATAFGSTAINRTYGGASIDIRNGGIAVTGKGICEPVRGFDPVVAADNSVFELSLLSPNKRPVAIQYDGLQLRATENNPFETLRIEKDQSNAVTLLLTQDPATRAFSALAPK